MLEWPFAVDPEGGVQSWALSTVVERSSIFSSVRSGRQRGTSALGSGIAADVDDHDARVSPMFGVNLGHRVANRGVGR